MDLDGSRFRSCMCTIFSAPSIFANAMVPSHGVGTGEGLSLLRGSSFQWLFPLSQILHTGYLPFIADLFQGDDAHPVFRFLVEILV